LDARRINPGTILIEKAGGSSTRPAGRVVYCDREFGGTASNFVEVIQVEKARCPKYVFYLLYNNFRSGLVYKYQQQTTGIINFKLGEYSSEIVCVPESRAEQSKIAEVLSTVDRAIAQTEALIAKQQRIKTGLMQDLLTRGIDEDGQLRSEATHAFKDSPLGRIPVEWEVVQVDQLVSRVGSGITPTGGESVYTTEGVLFIRSQNVHFGGLRLDDVAYIPMRIHRSMLRSEVFENDVLLNITGASIGRCCLTPKIEGHANVNQHVCAIRLRDVDEARAGFLTAVLQSHIGQHQIRQMNAGGNREGLNYQQVRSFEVPWPADHLEFGRIYRRVAQMNSTISDHRASLGKLRDLKTAMMQDLLTGKVRVTPLLQPAGETTA
jgi:type I restriction enzyme S subunit